MIRCIAIDDEPLALEQLKAYIRKVPYLELVEACPDAFRAMQVLAAHPVDVMFVDINMPDLNGLDFIRTLQCPPMVVFTTAYSEYAIDGYKVSAVDYLLKPFGLEDFRRAADKVLRRYELLHGTPASPSTTDDDILFLKSEYKTVNIRISHIRYVESMSEYLRIYLDGEPKPLIVLLSMKKIEERLPTDRFMRVHRSYIVNLKKIREVARMRIWLDSATSIPIGELYKDTFMAYINALYLGK